VDLRRWIEIGVPVAAVTALLTIWTWIGIDLAVGGRDCRTYESTPPRVRIGEALVLFAAAAAILGAFVNVVALADPRRRARAWRGLVASVGAFIGLVGTLFIALALTVSGCANDALAERL
jgi:hypothetical protein